MNRIIKFRFWDKENSKILLWKDLFNDNKYSELFYATDIVKWKWDLVVMQYIGLKDKNWVEIYESDVVELYQKAHGYIKTKIVFKNWWFELRALDSNRIWMFWDIITQNEISMEIIGNIYSNPELINNQ